MNGASRSRPASGARIAPQVMMVRNTRAGTPISAAIAHAPAPNPPEAPDDDRAKAPALAVGGSAVEPLAAPAGSADGRSGVAPGCPGLPSSAWGSLNDPAMEVSPAASPTGSGRVSGPG